jgi:hypothetical protein
MGFGDNAFFEEGRWPINSRSEITHHHFEDLRKRLFILINPDCGHSPNTDWDPTTSYAFQNWVGYKGKSYESVWEGSGNVGKFPDVSPTYWKPIRNSIHTGTEEIEDSYLPPAVPFTGEEILWRRGVLYVVWKGELWTNRNDIVAYQWGQDYTKHSWEPPYEMNQPVRVKVGSTIYKSLKVHKSSPDAVNGFAADLASGYWAVDNDVPENDLNQPYYTPPAWEADKVYFINKWIRENDYWTHKADYSFYHDFDPIKKIREIGHAGYGSGEDYIEQNWDFYAYCLLPTMTDPITHLPAALHAGDKLRYTYGSKVGFNSRHITIPHLAGAQWNEVIVQMTEGQTSSWVRGDPVAGTGKMVASGTQYSNGLNLPPYKSFEIGTPSGATWDKNPKRNESYQCQIEMMADFAELKAEIIEGTAWGDRYIQAYNKNQDVHHAGAQKYWGDNTADYPKYDSMMHPFWGNNQSGFELVKEMTGDFDWYWDDEYPYRNLNHIILHSHVSLPKTSANFPSPAGTWRRWWKYSMGRPFDKNGNPKFMLPGSVTPPRVNYDSVSGAYWFGVVNGQDVEFMYPNNTWVATEPTINTMFSGSTAWSLTISVDAVGVGETTNIFKVSGDQTAKLHPGWIIYIGTGTALAGYQWCYVVESKYDAGENKTIVRCSIETTSLNGKTAKGDVELSQRHDPVQVDMVDGSELTPTYELTKELVEEMHDALYHYTCIPIDADLESRYCAADIGGLSGYYPPVEGFGSIGDALAWQNGVVDGMPRSPEEWFENNPNLPDGISAGLSSDSTSLRAKQYRGASQIIPPPQNGNPVTVAYEGYSGTWYSELCSAQALKVKNVPAMYNSSHVIIKMMQFEQQIVVPNYDPEWADPNSDPPYQIVGNWESPDTENTQQFQTAADITSIRKYAGTSWPPAEDEFSPIRVHYHQKALPVDGGWLVFYPTRVPKLVLADRDDNDRPRVYMGSALVEVEDISDSPLYIVIDYNKVPRPVFARDRWGYIQWHTEPLDPTDKEPPLPNPIIWRHPATPQIYFVRKEANLETPNGREDVEFGDHYEMRVKSEVCLAEDKKGSNPVQYRMVGVDATSAPDSDWQETIELDHLIRKMYFSEAILTNTVPCNFTAPNNVSIDVVIDDVHYTKILCTPGTTINVDDYVNVYNVVLPQYSESFEALVEGEDPPTSNPGKISLWDILARPIGYKVVAKDSSSITLETDRYIQMTFLAQPFDSNVARHYVFVVKRASDDKPDEGWKNTAWENSDEKDYEYRPQARDSAVPPNEGKLGEQVTVIMPDEFPFDIETA